MCMIHTQEFDRGINGRHRDSQTDSLVYRQTQRQPDRHIDIQTQTEAERRTDRDKEREGDGQTRTVRQIEPESNERRLGPVLCVGIAGMHTRAYHM